VGARFLFALLAGVLGGLFRALLGPHNPCLAFCFGPGCYIFWAFLIFNFSKRLPLDRHWCFSWFPGGNPNARQGLLRHPKGKSFPRDVRGGGALVIFLRTDRGGGLPWNPKEKSKRAGVVQIFWGPRKNARTRPDTGPSRRIGLPSLTTKRGHITGALRLPSSRGGGGPNFTIIKDSIPNTPKGGLPLSPQGQGGGGGEPGGWGGGTGFQLHFSP